MLFKNISQRTGLQKIIYFIFFLLCFLKLFLGKSDLLILDYMTYFQSDFFHFLYTNPSLAKIIILFLLLFNSIALYFLLKKHKLIELHNYTVSTFYLIFCLYFLSSSFLIPLFLNSLIILFLFPLLLTISEQNYKPEQGIVFGLFCGIISLFYAPFILFFLFAFIILQLNGMYYWKNYIMPIVGLIICYIYFFSILYLIDFKGFTSFFSFYLNQFKLIDFSIISFSYIEFIIFGCILLFYFLFSFSLLYKSPNMNILIRKKYYCLLISSLLGILLNIFFIENQFLGSIVFVSILSLIGGIVEQFIKYRFIYNIIIIILLICIIINCCIPIIPNA